MMDIKENNKLLWYIHAIKCTNNKYVDDLR